MISKGGGLGRIEGETGHFSLQKLRKMSVFARKMRHYSQKKLKNG